ncbi:MAG TPA: sigma-70 family RNA polymerase sigma factor [Bacteroidales bacterium]|nr:sigma-70 family RNA polymerase sigma factor [Bacteroidales bacterium]
MNPKEEKFRKIVEQQQQRIRSICRYYSRSDEDTQDLQQEVLINVWRSLDNFRGDSAISTWIYRIAVNTSLNYIMKENRRSQFNLTLSDQHFNLLMQDNESERKLETEKKLDGLHEVINQLNVIDKLLITLSIEKLTTKEISDIIGITEPNVRTKLHRIREELKQKIQGGIYEKL